MLPRFIVSEETRDEVGEGTETHMDVNGVTAEVVKDVTSAEAVICGDTSYFSDDVFAKCSECQAPIVHRPHAPNVRKVCGRCAVTLIVAGLLAEKAN